MAYPYMNVQNVLHMSGGDEAHSYARNSIPQKSMSSKVTPLLEETIKTMYTKSFPSHFVVADMGCSSGPNVLSSISTILDLIFNLLKQKNNKHVINSPHEVSVFLNDLPSNDFNSVFRSIPELHRKLELEDHVDGSDRNVGLLKCFISGVPGSFYGRLLPTNSLNFVYTSCSLHWLSQVPEEVRNNNKGNICLSKSSPPGVLEACMKEFERGFSLFLSSRAEELVRGGQMLLLCLVRNISDDTTNDYFPFWSILAKSLAELAREEVLEEEGVNSFVIHTYFPRIEEIKNTVAKQRSFDIDSLQSFEQCWGANEPCDGRDDVYDVHKCAQIMTGTYRAISEPMLKNHFGDDKLDTDDLFERCRRHIGEYLSTVEEWPMHFCSALLLTKKEPQL